MDFEIEDLKNKGYYIAYVDCEKCKEKQSFLQQVGLAFKFPVYYGQNLDALDECINDLSWINERNFLLVFLNSSWFLANETEESRKGIYEILIDARKQWASVPNYKGEEHFRCKADFVILKK